MTQVSVLEAPVTTREAHPNTKNPSREAEFSAFFRENHPKAMEIARRVFMREQDAEDAVSDAFLRVIQGDCPSRYFYRGLKQVMIDRLRKLRTESAATIRLDLRMPRESNTGQGKQQAERPGDRAVSHHREDQDPLDRMVREEDLHAAYKEGKSNWRHRWIQQRDWWREFEKFFEPERSETACSNA